MGSCRIVFFLAVLLASPAWTARTPGDRGFGATAYKCGGLGVDAFAQEGWKPASHGTGVAPKAHLLTAAPSFVRTNPGDSEVPS